MQTITKITLVLHIISGSIALFTGILAILFRNKIKIHKPIGFTFYCAMTAVFITSVYLSVVKLHLFFFLIGFFTYHSALIGYRALKYKQLHLGQKVNKIDWVIEYVALIINSALILFALYLLFITKNNGGIIPLVFGALGLRGVLRNIKNFKLKNVTKSFWLQKHIGNMCGSYIGTITAFVVNMNKYWDLPQIITWLGPTLIFTPIIFMEIKKLRNADKKQLETIER